MKRLAVVLVVVAMGALTAACATTRAQAPATRMPALEVPPVPPRVIEPPPPLPTPMPEPVGELPPPPPPSSSKPRPPRDTTQKPEPKAAETAAEQPPVAAVNPPAAVPPLRTARTPDSVQAERKIRDIIGSANSLLGKVNYSKLTPERQKAFNQAKQFIEMAEGAIRDAKYEYALELADKAETLAKELQG
jgi:type IV secretory pathway VirB10-like protein